MSRRIGLLVLFIMVGIFCFGSLALAHDEAGQGKYYTLVDENNKIIHLTSTRVYVGDEYISSDNSRYKVMSVSSYQARCQYKGKEKMPVIKSNDYKQSWIFAVKNMATSKDKPTIAVYHTHSDESYVPSDGKESINGNGGIYDVGKVFVERLRSRGLNVQYSKENHNPHDVNAYNRSRRTAVSLIRKSAPDAVIDIHRDAVPAEQYKAEVDGKPVTQIKLVVGRTNPNMKTNLEFAKNMKAVMDEKKPGLSNGIYMGKGDYNQDLSPRAMLVEVGAHTNSKEEAQKGIELLADTMPTVLGANVGGPAAQKPPANDNQGSGTAIMVLLVIVIAGTGGYYLINRGSNRQ
ncbi:MAG: stage II sporulation protein P [Syntrophomonadaceae bacterium]|nr:stage II sporulation protein P [Syntrophomonadaceae bacterium]